MPIGEFRIQPAEEEHAAAIRRLVITSGINPTGLDWHRFLIAVDDEEQLIGCGQLKPHRDGSLELASLAVKPNWRQKGVARALMEALLADQEGDIYLMCQSSLGPMYEKFGFHDIKEAQMPTYFRRVSKLVGVLEALRTRDETLLIMHRPPQEH